MIDHSQGDELVVIVAAGGLGSRFGGVKPKQLVEIAGHTVLHYTLRRFDTCDVVDRVVVAANGVWIDEIRRLAANAVTSKPISVVEGAGSRNASIEKALEFVPKNVEFVLVHDGVRPLVSHSLINSVAAALKAHRSVVPVVQAIDLLAVVENNIATRFLSRAEVWNGQSPQGFRVADLRAAFDHAARLKTSEFATLFELLHSWDPTINICAIPGEPANIKITLPIDQIVAGQLILAEIQGIDPSA